MSMIGPTRAARHNATRTPAYAWSHRCQHYPRRLPRWLIRRGERQSRSMSSAGRDVVLALNTLLRPPTVVSPSPSPSPYSSQLRPRHDLSRPQQNVHLWRIRKLTNPSSPAPLPQPSTRTVLRSRSYSADPHHTHPLLPLTVRPLFLNQVLHEPASLAFLSFAFVPLPLPACVASISVSVSVFLPDSDLFLRPASHVSEAGGIGRLSIEVW
ncbi:uncharacterized protein STEHIDRAFT_150069, partial [Stereum hirsutum FP-91666 SS1]|uniref:uncharacterized protein n=1 Tax=Stereum hirsutum (strain FP-91666) TaxID=721885 RepID=UPI000444A4B7